MSLACREDKKIQTTWTQIRSHFSVMKPEVRDLQKREFDIREELQSDSHDY